MKKILFGVASLALGSHGISYGDNVKAQPSKNIETVRTEQMTQEKTTPQYLYKVISVEGWQDSQQQNQVINSTLDDKFIHLATESQLPHVKQRFWSGKRYFVLKLDPNKLKGRLVFETNPGGTTQYYHLYEGIIPLDAVIDVFPADNP